MKKLNFLAFACAIPMVALSCGNMNDTHNIPEATSNEITRVEPPSWWIGMKTRLQLMVQGKDISGYQVSIEGYNGVKVKEVHKADNPDFIFIDIDVSTTARPGTFHLIFSKGKEQFKYAYTLSERSKGSESRTSFNNSDLIYLINPDRFANGDPTNDSTSATTEPSNRKAPFGRHGGDIQGIIDHLDYIAGLGATAIWPTPLLEDNLKEESYHGYACTDYYRIDPRFGTNELYREMVSKAHEKGLKVILDVVTNHCGIDHWWMKDMPFKDWVNMHDEYVGTSHRFSVLTDPYGSQHDREIMSRGWFVPSMPDMNLDNPFVLSYFEQWAAWWIEYAGLDGLRVDTYPYNAKEAMSEWCASVRREYPGMNIVGECWDHSPAAIAYWQTGNGNKDGFDTNLPTVMDFPLFEAMCRSLGVGPRGTLGDITDVYDSLSGDYAYANPFNLLIFFANHDCLRFGDIVRRNPDKMKIAYSILATIRGIPQIFYGDEMMFANGTQHKSDGILRMDFPGGWEGDKVNLFTAEGRAAAEANHVALAADSTTFNATKSARDTIFSNAASLHDYASRLFNWRKGKTVIHTGKTLEFLPKDNTYAYFRYNESEAVFVFINNSAEDRKIPWGDYAEIASKLPSAGTNVMTGETITIGPDTKVPPTSALLVEYSLK